ncbi:dihydropteroate synthase [Candidatus Planktophila dulcis]|jgi:dihydropteroate synthase|uniref:dihydropteroate synthase n=1 Tax=Candidatus Planktophila dulcis TaxID=1884914 RepID=UPI000BACA013|nr:dihydropteroate synthase [Candidatus Planktophila dulcis]ASY15088.1 dihydropteroate synthase [Candidatus Planktophila dulcis]ASY21764.1 dihydropteroate synthase [Candidatus Planktophila dulcis]
MLVMGILNVTPDSFADGGLHYEESLAITHGLEMIEDGVDIIDVGGESTRPGADRISEEEEQARVIPVIRELAKKGVVISIDTMRATTAKLAVEAGASIVNDVSGGAADPDMFSTVAQLGCKYTLMHWRGHSKDMNEKAIYGDVVAEVIEEVTLQLDKALAAGVKRENIILDPGIGFAKNAEHNWEVLNRIDEFVALGYPVLIGHSRKRFLGGEHPDEREEATVAVTQSLVGKGIWAVRVHGVKANVKAARS